MSDVFLSNLTTDSDSDSDSNSGVLSQVDTFILLWGTNHSLVNDNELNLYVNPDLLKSNFQHQEDEPKLNQAKLVSVVVYLLNFTEMSTLEQKPYL